MKILDNLEPCFSGPLDVRYIVNSSAELVALASNAVSYPYMKVVNKEDGYTYELATDKTWHKYPMIGQKGETLGAKGAMSSTKGTPVLTVEFVNNEVKVMLTLPPLSLAEEDSRLNTSAKDLIGSINELVASIVTVNTSVTTLSTSLSTLSDSVTSLTTRVKALEDKAT